MKRVLTGIQATAEQIHLGNYFGAVKPMVDMVNSGEHEVFCFVANMHSLTELHDGKAIRQYTLNLVKAYLACGLDPQKTTLYLGSAVPGHAQLQWVLACMTHVGFMKRMHAYKAAFDDGRSDEISMGTFNYPILMAADILLYDAQYVPVGKDQKQHVEYARDIAQKFNHSYGETFVLPEPLIREEVATVPGIDGRKMSKSYNNFIGLFDDAETVRKKVARIPTDALPVEAPKDPTTCNVFAIYKLFLDATQETALRERYLAGGLSYKDLKWELAEQISTYLAPLQERYHAISDEEVRQVLAAWQEVAGAYAAGKIAQVYEKVGFIL